MTARTQLCILLLCTALAAVMGQQAAAPNVADDVCIGCICEAASNCNQTAGCHGGMCGLFRITKPYWIDAGKFVLSGDDAAAEDAWVRCVTDTFCAALTVQGYLAKFQKDCNGDGLTDCHDYAAIHHLGGYGCNSRPLDPKYDRQFQACMAHVSSLSG